MKNQVTPVITMDEEVILKAYCESVNEISACKIERLIKILRKKYTLKRMEEYTNE